MVSSATVNRLIATAADLDLTGLGIIGYYLRLYAIKLILADDETTEEFMGQVSELMESVEGYKRSVESADGEEGEDSVYSLVCDEERAKTYVLNFAMSLYNGKLKQIQSGPWDYTLQRGLWCCIDLFSCVQSLWEDNDGSLQRRIKYCKVYLTRLAKGELGDRREPAGEAAAVAAASPEASQESEGNLSDDGISGLLKRLRTTGSDEASDLSSADISMPLAPRIKPRRGGEPESGKEPKFIDSEPEEEVRKLDVVPEKESKEVGENRRFTQDQLRSMEEVQNRDVVPEKQPKQVAENRRFTQDQLQSMMEKSTQIEKAQKLAKYAISALNYDDIPTAKDELIKALEILNALE